MYKERLDAAWKKVTVDWVEGTIELSFTFWEARQSCKANIAFGKWLTEQGYGLELINEQDRSALVQMGNPKIRDIVREELTRTSKSSWQKIWGIEIRARLGIISQPRNTVTNYRYAKFSITQTPGIQTSTPKTSVTQPAPSCKPLRNEGDIARQFAKEIGLEVWATIEEAPVLGRMPDDTEEKIKEHLREINARCHELFQISLYADQMSEGARKRLAVEFKGIKLWGEMLMGRMLGHENIKKAINAPLCDVVVPFRKPEH